MKSARNNLTTVVLVLAIIVAGLIVIPSLFGFDRYVITGSSMDPTIPKGSVVYSKPTATEALRVGDIITYSPPPDTGVDTLVTHRIAERTERQDASGRSVTVFRTMGDNNDRVDPWQFTLDDGEGALEKAHLPYLGWIYLVLGIPWVRIVLITVPALLIVLFTAIALWREAGREVEEERERLRLERQGRADLNPPATA